MLPSNEVPAGSREELLGQLELFFDAERGDIEQAIQAHEKTRPDILDKLEKQIEYSEGASKLEGRAEELSRFRAWRETLQK